jgi:hypothetical protein
MEKDGKEQCASESGVEWVCSTSGVSAVDALVAGTEGCTSQDKGRILEMRVCSNTAVSRDTRDGDICLPTSR